MKLKTILVDDEPRGLSALKKLLELNCPEVEVIATCSNADEAVEQIDALQPQLVFLDIAMPQKNAFDLLQGIGSFNFEIIFVTAHNNYMLQAFRYSAVDYLLKPVEHNLLVDAVERVVKRVEQKQRNPYNEALLHNLHHHSAPEKMKLCIPSVRGFQVVILSELLYCESSSNYTNFYFINRPMICSARPMHEYEKLLSDRGFVRVHKSFVVNLEHVTEYIRGEGGSLVLSNGMQLEVSRRKKDYFLNRMREYYKY